MSTRGLQHQHWSRGFTLIEVLVALVVLALVSVGVIGFFATVVETSRQTDAEQTVTIQVKSYLENVAGVWEAGVDDSNYNAIGFDPPAACVEVFSLGDGVRTVTVTCQGIDAPFILSMGVF